MLASALHAIRESTTGRQRLIDPPWPPPGREDALEIGLPDNGGDDNCTLRSLDISRTFTYILTDDGELVSVGGVYQTSLDLGDFCLDWVLNNSFPATIQRFA